MNDPNTTESQSPQITDVDTGVEAKVEPHPETALELPLTVSRDLWWSALLITLAHLLVAWRWWFYDRLQVVETGPLAGVLPHVAPDGLTSIPVAKLLFLWLGGALLSLVPITRQLGSLGMLFGMMGCIGALSPELIGPADQALFAVTALMIGMSRRAYGAYVARWGAWILFTAWAWISLATILGGDATSVRGWRWGYMINYWGWTDAAPTPLALTFAQSPQWLRSFVGMTLMSALAWGPILGWLKIRYWWLVWGGLAPLALWLGDGLPSWQGSAVMLTLSLALDVRWRKGLDQLITQVLKRVTLERVLTCGPLSSQRWLVGFPALLLGSWLTLSVDELSVTLIVGALWFASVPSLSSTSTRSPHASAHASARPPMRATILTTALALLFLGVWSSVIGERLINPRQERSEYSVRAHSKTDVTADSKSGSESGSESGSGSTSWTEAWSLSSELGEWAQLRRSRDRLIIELSEDSNGSWRDVTLPELAMVSLERQPWTPLTSHRYARWYHELAKRNECEEGPLMNLLERSLKRHIRELIERTPTPQRTRAAQASAVQDTLIRIRRESWVRSYQGFWRAQGAGFYCIPTNLPVLLKARGFVKQSRERLPDMPRLAPQPQRAVKRSPTQTPPTQTRPAQAPPTQTTPTQTTPTQTTPTQTPPTQTTPTQTPPTQAP